MYMKNILFPLLLLVNFVFAQSDTEKKFIEITDFTVTGHPKAYLKVKLYFENDKYYKTFELYIEPVSKYGGFDITKRNAGLTGTISRNGSVDLSNKIEYDLDYQYGYDNQKLKTVQYGPLDWWSSMDYIHRSGVMPEDILNHSRLTVIGKIKGSRVVIIINLNNKDLHQYVKKSLEPTKEEEEAKAKVIADEDSIRKADEEFRSKYGYLFTISGTTTKPDKFTLDNIDNFIVNFNHGNKIPMDAIFNYNSGQSSTIGTPNCIILKTNKEAVFYDWQKIESSVEIGVLPKGKLIRVHLGGAIIRQIGAKKYVSVSLEINDPWCYCQKPKYQLQDRINGLILLESLEFGNASDIEDFRAQVKEFGVIQRNSWKGIKIPCEEIVPKN